MVSIIIPARNEIYLEKTIRNILDNAEGEIEVLAILDGYIPDPQIDMKDDRVLFIHNQESIGQRQSINLGARMAKGEYIMKLDAHCAVDKGFDIKLAKDCEYDWTVVPRMYNLDVETWEPKLHKRTDYMYISSPTGEKPFRASYYTGKKYRALHIIESNHLIDDTMCCMGPGWFMHKDRFWELDGMDEGHGGWGQMGIEVACKAWLSGGALKVNKNTWFAHWFRGGGGPGFPYHITGNDQEKARVYSRDLWLNNKWNKKKRDFQWLVDKFNPPEWEKESMKVNPIEVRAKQKRQWSHVKGLVISMDELMENILEMRDRRRAPERSIRRLESMPPFIRKILNGETFTDEQLAQQPYYAALRHSQKINHQRSMMFMKDMVNLVHSIKAEGIRNPVDLWWAEGHLVIHRGWRRILIMKELGYKKVVCRVYKNREGFLKHARYRFHKPDDSINGLAMKQFMKLQDRATDKYWVHGYTELYDKHIGYMKGSARKILEIGVFRGASLLLWKQYFRKALIYGVDKNTRIWQKFLKGVRRIKVFVGRQEDEEFMKREVIPAGGYDIIIDDGGHMPDQMQSSFNILWKSVNPGGWYIIEDLYGNYKHSRIENTTMGMLKKLIDDMNTKGKIKSMHFYYNICFIQKL